MLSSTVRGGRIVVRGARCCSASSGGTVDDVKSRTVLLLLIVVVVVVVVVACVVGWYRESGRRHRSVIVFGIAGWLAGLRLTSSRPASRRRATPAVQRRTLASTLLQYTDASLSQTRNPTVAWEGRPYSSVGRPANDFRLMWRAICDFLLVINSNLALSRSHNTSVTGSLQTGALEVNSTLWAI